MSESINKQLMQRIMDSLATGDTAPFVHAMAEDFTWTIAGQGVWSGSWRGKKEVLELMQHLFAQFATTYTSYATRLIAEGPYVVVECRGNVATIRGDTYRNHYCYVCEIADGKLKELTEYLDSALTERTMTPPPGGQSAFDDDA